MDTCFQSTPILDNQTTAAAALTINLHWHGPRDVIYNKTPSAVGDGPASSRICIYLCVKLPDSSSVDLILSLFMAGFWATVLMGRLSSRLQVLHQQQHWQMNSRKSLMTSVTWSRNPLMDMIVPYICSCCACHRNCACISGEPQMHGLSFSIWYQKDCLRHKSKNERVVRTF